MTPLHMHHLPLDVRRTMQFAARHRLLGQKVGDDLGYIVHTLLCSLFGGERAPKPFNVPQQGVAQRSDLDAGTLPLLAYASAPLDDLRGDAERMADADALSAVDWDRAASKPIPTLRNGASYAFTLRCCPVVRMSRTERDVDYKPGTEVDAYRAARIAAERNGTTAPDRYSAYLAWLDRAVGSDAAHLRSQEVVALRKVRVARRSREKEGSRPLRAMTLPDVTFRGELEVGDVNAFRDLLSRGIGRHRAFGFGMMLLRRTVDE